MHPFTRSLIRGRLGLYMLLAMVSSMLTLVGGQPTATLAQKSASTPHAHPTATQAPGSAPAGRRFFHRRTRKGDPYVFSEDGFLYSIDSATGFPNWGNGVVGNSNPTLFLDSSPVLAGGINYIGSNDGRVFAFNSTTGAQIWQYPLVGVTPIGAVRSTPRVVAGIVYVSAEDGLVYELNASSGAFIRSFGPGAPASAFDSSPAVATVGATRNVYIGSDDGKLYAFNSATGTAITGFPVTVTGGSPIKSSPTVATVAGTPTVYVGADDGNLYAFNASTGVAISGFPVTTGNSVRSTPAVVTTGTPTVYVGSEDGLVYAFNASTGASIWSVGPGVQTSAFDSSPTVATATVNGVSTPIVFIGSDDGNVYALKASDGTQVWKTPTLGLKKVKSSPAVATVAVNGVSTLTVFIGADDDNLYAFNANNGVFRWRYTTGGGVRSTPLAA